MERVRLGTVGGGQGVSGEWGGRLVSRGAIGTGAGVAWRLPCPRAGEVAGRKGVSPQHARRRDGSDPR